MKAVRILWQSLGETRTAAGSSPSTRRKAAPSAHDLATGLQPAEDISSALSADDPDESAGSERAASAPTRSLPSSLLASRVDEVRRWTLPAFKEPFIGCRVQRRSESAGGFPLANVAFRSIFISAEIRFICLVAASAPADTQVQKFV